MQDMPKHFFTRCPLFAIASYVWVNLAFAQTPLPVLTTPLIAGQNTTIGQVQCSLDSSNFTNGSCTATTTSGWCMANGHLYVGTTAPTSMAPGQFPFKLQPSSCVTALTIAFTSIPLCDGKSTVTAAFHVEARLPSTGREETGWAKGTPTGFNWSMSNTLLCPFDT
jgi:hypothetical protein